MGGEGTLLAVCVSARKGTVKRAVERARLLPEHGIEGDAHAGPWHRQVSLLDIGDIAAMRAQGLELEWGAFGENLVVEGVDLSRIGIGTRLEVGAAELEVTQIGKECHTRCAIYHRTGDCIMPRAGVFARVVRGGEVAPGEAVRVVRAVPREAIQVAVLTVSDSRAAGLAEDTAGPAVARLLAERLGAHVAWYGIEPDDRERLEARLRDLVGRGLDLVLTAGGTGFGPRDVTPEATRAVMEREAPGLAEAMRAASREATPHAVLQRGVAGIARRTLIVNLPGSERAARENLEAILPALPHAVGLLRGHTAHAGDPRVRGGAGELPVVGGAFGGGR